MKIEVIRKIIAESNNRLELYDRLKKMMMSDEDILKIIKNVYE